MPVDEIAAVINRYVGKILKRAGEEIIVIPRATDARISVEAGEDGVGESAV